LKVCQAIVEGYAKLRHISIKHGRLRDDVNALFAKNDNLEHSVEKLSETIAALRAHAKSLDETMASRKFEIAKTRRNLLEKTKVHDAQRKALEIELSALDTLAGEQKRSALERLSAHHAATMKLEHDITQLHRDIANSKDELYKLGYGSVVPSLEARLLHVRNEAYSLEQHLLSRRREDVFHRSSLRHEAALERDLGEIRTELSKTQNLLLQHQREGAQTRGAGALLSPRADTPTSARDEVPAGQPPAEFVDPDPGRLQRDANITEMRRQLTEARRTLAEISESKARQK
jgi:chromosome segregation ATPase